MLRNATQHVCLEALAAVILACCQADAEQLVLVIDRAEVPKAVLAEAGQLVARIFEKAGIELRLPDCPSPPETANFDDFVDEQPLYVQVLSTRPVKPMSRAALGYANTTPEGGQLAYIFYPQLGESMATVRPAPSRAQILGHAMAHEIGHLLGGPQHGPSGLMRRTWDNADFRQMAGAGILIAAPDAARMRENLERRAASARPGGIIEVTTTAHAPSAGNPGPAAGLQLDAPARPGGSL